MFSVPFNCINHVILLPDPEKTDKSEEDILIEAYITLMDAMMMSTCAATMAAIAGPPPR